MESTLLVHVVRAVLLTLPLNWHECTGEYLLLWLIVLATPFSNQFALFLEISRLVPMKFVASKAYEKVMSLERDLQDSGSDIVIEEHLADIFGRNQVSSKFVSSLTTVINQSDTTIQPPSLSNNHATASIRSWQNETLETLQSCRNPAKHIPDCSCTCTWPFGSR